MRSTRSVEIPRVPELDLEHADELARILGAFVQRDQRLGRRQVLRVEREHLLVRAHGAVGLGEPIAIELRDLHVQDDLGGVVLGLDLALEHADVLVVLVLRRVELLELVPVLLLQVELLERVLAALVLRLDVEQRSPRRDRLRRLVDLVGEQDAELLQRRDLLDAIVDEPRLRLQTSASLSQIFSRS